MLTLFGGNQRFCDGISRRNFLQIGAFGAGLTLADMLRSNAVAGPAISKLRSGSSDVPPFVSLRGMSRGTEPSYLGIAHRPFTPSGPGAQNLKLPGGIDMVRNDDRKGLLDAFDSARREVDASGTMK